jgi:hypothetical protein
MPIDMRVLTARGLLRCHGQLVSTEKQDRETGNVGTAILTSRVSSVQVSRKPQGFRRKRN